MKFVKCKFTVLRSKSHSKGEALARMLIYIRFLYNSTNCDRNLEYSIKVNVNITFNAFNVLNGIVLVFLMYSKI